MLLVVLGCIVLSIASISGMSVVRNFHRPHASYNIEVLFCLNVVHSLVGLSSRRV